MSDDRKIPHPIFPFSDQNMPQADPLHMSEEDGAFLDTAAAHDGALLAFATNFELIKKLARIIGWETIPVEGRDLMRNYLAALADGADAFVEDATAEDGPTMELTKLFREINDARNWLADHMEAE